MLIWLRETVRKEGEDEIDKKNYFALSPFCLQFPRRPQAFQIFTPNLYERREEPIPLILLLLLLLLLLLQHLQSQFTFRPNSAPSTFLNNNIRQGRCLPSMKEEGRLGQVLSSVTEATEIGRRVRVVTTTANAVGIYYPCLRASWW